jgi:hypothetical protein
MHTEPLYPLQAFLVGFPRCGSSWIGKATSRAPGTIYVREPDNARHIKQSRLEFRHTILLESHENPDLEAMLRLACSGRQLNAFTMCHHHAMYDPIAERLKNAKLLKHYRGIPFMDGLVRRLDSRISARRRKGRSLVLKLISTSLSIRWLHQTYGVKMVYLIRHPCGQMSSWKKMNWSPDIEQLLQSDLVRSRLTDEHRKVLACAKGFWARAGAYWGAMNYLVLGLSQGLDRLRIVPFESLCCDPVGRFKEVFDWLELPFSPSVRSFLESSNQAGRKGSYELHRRSQEMPEKWKERMHPDEIQACREYSEPFGWGPYENFEPHCSDVLIDPRKIAPSRQGWNSGMTG